MITRCNSGKRYIDNVSSITVTLSKKKKLSCNNEPRIFRQTENLTVEVATFENNLVRERVRGRVCVL